MKILLIFIHSILLIILSVAVGLSLYGMLGPPDAKIALTDDFGPPAFFLTQPIGQGILYVVFVLFLTYIIWRFQRSPISAVASNHYDDMVKRTEFLEKRQEAAFQQLTLLEASWSRLVNNGTPDVPIIAEASSEYAQPLLQIKQELHDVLEKIEHQKKYPYSELMDYIQTQIERVENQISDWATRPNDVVFEDYESTVELVGTPSLPPRRERIKGSSKKRKPSKAKASGEGNATPPVDPAPLDLSELPSRREAHAPWWRKRRAGEPKKEDPQTSDPLN